MATIVTPDEANNTMAFQQQQQQQKGLTRSASHTDTELDDEEVVPTGGEEEEELEPQVCKWENCTLELPSLDELINHVKIDHIGSGKVESQLGCLYKKQGSKLSYY